MTINDIKKEVIKLLNTNFPTTTIYGEEIKQGLLTPCFFVSILPITTNNQLYYKDKALMIKIKYISANETNDGYYNMIDDLETLFGLPLKVLNRYLTVNEFKSSIQGGILQFGFNVNVAIGAEVIQIENIDGITQVMLPDESLNYSQETTKLMSEIQFKQGVE